LTVAKTYGGSRFMRGNSSTGIISLLWAKVA
jgi:hypothetical protein